MKKVLMLLVLVTIVGMTSLYAQTEIWTADDLNNIRYDLGASYILMADIDLTSYSSGEGWVQIGTYQEPFSGTLDGNGFTITNLFINKPTVVNVGLFSFTVGATFTNVSVTNANVTGFVRVAALVGGECTYTTFTNCYASGEVHGGQSTGMLVAFLYSSSMSGCHSDGTVYGNDKYTGGLVGTSTEESIIEYSYSNATVDGSAATATGFGGLVGENSSSIITDCYATGDVSSVNDHVGGLVGSYYNHRETEKNIERCYATGSVTGNSDVAGLVGYMGTKCGLVDCYATGSVNGSNDVGGLLGWCGSASWGPSSVTNCYSTGAVSGSTWVGGLIGDQGNATTISNCYWNTETSGQAASSGGYGRTTDDMTYPYSDSTYVGWDFVDTWNNDVTYTINNGYPFLFTDTIIGDFNGDGYVDATDLQMFGDHWHFVDTDPGWEAMYDLEPDGVIDAADLQIFGDHWHEGTPPDLAKGGGPNSEAGIVFDLDATTYGNQNLTHIAPQAAGTMIRVDVYATGVHNLDTYEFNVVYDPNVLEYKGCAATNPLTFEENILTKNGGTAIGWMVDNSTPGILNIAYTLAGEDTTQAPEGEGLIADIVFQAKVTTYGMLSFSNVYYYDTFKVKDAITNTGTATLPVELSAFTATYNTVNGYTTLSWTTASETDILGYNVYRSTEDAFDASKKLNAAMINGHGTTTEMNTYEFVDVDQLNFGTTYYYWLESVEYGGMSTVYTSIKLTPEEGTGGFEDDFIVNSLSNYPNPFRNTTTISYSIKGMLKSEPVQISIYNMLGQLVDTIEGKYGTATWNTRDHSTGIYFYKLNTDSYTEIKKMMVTK